MQQILIRTCTKHDIDAVMQLERQWEHEDIAYGDFCPMSRDMFIACLERSPEYFLVAECEGELVGYIHGSAERNKPVEIIPAQEPYVEVENIYVSRDFRNRDVGGMLLEQLFDSAKQHGIQRFLVGTRSKETDKIFKFYQRHGFTAWSIQFFK